MPLGAQRNTVQPKSPIDTTVVAHHAQACGIEKTGATACASARATIEWAATLNSGFRRWFSRHVNMNEEPLARVQAVS